MNISLFPMSTITSPRRQESHRVYLQQFIQNNKTLESSINTTSAAIRLTLAATCQDVTQLLRQKFGLRPVQVKRDRDSFSSSGSLSALDRINARLGRNPGSSNSLDKEGKQKKQKRIYDRSKHDALVVVASCFVPRGYLRYEHESKHSISMSSNNNGGAGVGVGAGPANTQQQQPQGSLDHNHQQAPASEAFNIFRTLFPDENPLQVKNEMWAKAQHVQKEAHLLFGETTSHAHDDPSSIATGIHASNPSINSSMNVNSPTRNINMNRARQKPPIIRLFFVPCHDNGVPSNATIEIEGYCTDADSDDDKGDEDEVDYGDENRFGVTSYLNSNGMNEDHSQSEPLTPPWKRELQPYRYVSCQDQDGAIQISQDQRILVRERHRFAILSGLEASSGDGCVSGYLFKLCERDSNVWKRFHCVLPNNQQFWYVSRVKDVEAIARVDEEDSRARNSSNMITSRCVGKHGIIHLNGTLLMESISIDPTTLPLSGLPGECTFQLITKEGKTHTFRAGSRNAYSRWMHCISESIVRCQENSYFEMAEEIVTSM